MKAKISKDRFLDWVYSSTDDTESLVDDVISSLYSEGQFAIDLNSILDNISFIPASLVENLDEIKEDFKDSLDSDIFEYLKRVEEDSSSEIQLTDAIKLMLKDKDILGCKYEGIKFDCGSKKGFVAATLYKGLEDKAIKQEIENILGKN